MEQSCSSEMNTGAKEKNLSSVIHSLEAVSRLGYHSSLSKTLHNINLITALDRRNVLSLNYQHGYMHSEDEAYYEMQMHVPKTELASRPHSLTQEL